MKLKNNIHRSAVIDKNVVIGLNTKVWHWSHVCKNSKIGKIQLLVKMSLLVRM